MAKVLKLISSYNGKSSYGMPEYPGLEVSCKQGRSVKNSTDKTSKATLTNVTNEIVVTAKVPVKACASNCAGEVVSARIRISGSTVSRDRLVALEALLRKVSEALLNEDRLGGFDGGGNVTSVDLASEVDTIFKPIPTVTTK